MKSETELQKEGLDYCKSDPRVLFIGRAQSGKVRVRGGFMNLFDEGTPDLMGVHADGGAICIEYKTEEAFRSKNFGLSDAQHKKLTKVKNAGGYCGVACSIKDVDKILSGKHVGVLIWE